MFKSIRSDIRAAKQRDPAARSNFEILVCYPGVHALIWYRFSHWLWTHRQRFMARFISQAARLGTGIEIHSGAQIGRGLFIDHGMGTVIGETTEIGNDCTLYQGVTLGGTGKESGKRHPTLGNNVVVGVGAAVLGSIVIGDNVLVGAGSVVLRAVPADCTVVGIPARVIREQGRRLEENISGAAQADPCEQCMHEIERRFVALEKQFEDLQKRLLEASKSRG